MENRTRSLLLALTCFGWGSIALASNGAPEFKDYVVKQSTDVHNHPYVKTSQGSPAWESTRTKMAQQKPNLAGHYVAYGMDCGGTAACGEIIDIMTGKVVTSFPDAYSLQVEDDQETFDFNTRADSRLIIVMGGWSRGG